jgi:hypothetical protein
MPAEPRTYPRSQFARTLWGLLFIIGLVAGAASLFGLGTGLISIGESQTSTVAKWLGASIPMAVLSGWGLWKIAFWTKGLTLHADRITLEQAAAEEEILYSNLARIVCIPHGRKWRIALVDHEGTGYRFEWPDLDWTDDLSKRTGIPVEGGRQLLEELAAETAGERHGQ